jgi:cell division protease FtsH
MKTKLPENQKTIALWLMILMIAITVFVLTAKHKTPDKHISFNELITAIEKNEVSTLKIQEDEYSGKFKTDYKDGVDFFTIGPINSEQVFELVKKSDANMEYEKPKGTPFWQQLFLYLPILIVIGFFFYMFRSMQAGGGKALSFGKSRAQLLNESSRKVTFKDVAGVEESKEELEEIIQFLKEPRKFTKLGARIPKGVLLMGSPGTGKTLLARAVAGEASVPFYSISGSDFVEMFVGVGASRVRDLFEQGKKNAPCIIFIDEIDAVGRHRGSGLGGGHDEREQTLNQLLVEMDGFESNEGVIIISATNRPDVLDPALLRPGRFDRRIVVVAPDLLGREAILKIHSRKVPLDKDVDLIEIARGTPGFCGADLENLVNEAALYAARYDKPAVTKHDMEVAKDKVLMGSERRSMLISDEEKKVTAYHEAGHTLIAKLLPNTDPVHKVTIIPRGRALGLTQQLPEQDKYTQSKEYSESMISVLMGGRVAEEVAFSQITTGASNDIDRATQIAHKMACYWGMSERLGPVRFGKDNEHVFLGKEFGMHHKADYSESTAQAIDEEIQSIVQRNYDRSRDIISSNKDKLDDLAKALIEFEVLDAKQITMIMEGETLPPLDISHRKSNSDTKKPEEKKEDSSDVAENDPKPEPQQA